MRFRTAISLATFFLVCFTVAVWTTPLSAQDKVKMNPSTEMQTVSGKIASVGDAEFSLEIKANQKQDKVQFLIDGNTKVEGKLSIGAQATVDYRSVDGKNIANRVTVIPASGIELF